MKHYTQTKKDKIDKMSLDDKQEINDILGERITKLRRKYKVAWKPTQVHKSGLLNSKDALKFYQRRIWQAKAGSLQVHSFLKVVKVKGRVTMQKGWG